jgi:hypothetical protein
MDFGSIMQLKNRKSLWIDVLFYFAVSLFIAMAFCYIIFAIKISLQKGSIKDFEKKTAEIGTEEQKNNEKEITGHQKRIADYSLIAKDHKIASNVLLFLEELTLAKVWFNKFDMSEKEGLVNLSGEAENMDILSQQVSLFEKNEYIEKISLLNSGVGENGRISFNMNLALKPEIFTLFKSKSAIAQENAAASEEATNPENPPAENQ